MIDSFVTGLPHNVREALDKAARLAEECFAARADDYDRRAQFPAEDFKDLFAAGASSRRRCPPRREGLAWARTEATPSPCG
jgi:hypothetical protein